MKFCVLLIEKLSPECVQTF